MTGCKSPSEHQCRPDDDDNESEICWQWKPASVGSSLGTILVTGRQTLMGDISQSSTGLSTTMDLGSSRHWTGPSVISQSRGEQRSRATLSHPVRGVVFTTSLRSRLQTSRGRETQSPPASSQWGSITLSHSGTSSSTYTPDTALSAQPSLILYIVIYRARGLTQKGNDIYCCERPEELF